MRAQGSSIVVCHIFETKERQPLRHPFVSDTARISNNTGFLICVTLFFSKATRTYGKWVSEKIGCVQIKIPA